MDNNLQTLRTYEDPRNVFVQEYIMRRDGKKITAQEDPRLRRSVAVKALFFRATELTLIGVSFVGSSYIARFLVAKVSMDTLVEITDRFGPTAGHMVATILSVIVAEPRILAVIVAGVLVVIEVAVRLIRLGRRRKRCTA